MKRTTLVLFLILGLFASCTSKKNVHDMLKGNFKVNIYPEDIKIDLLNQDNMVKLLILLHNRVSRDEILDELKITENEYDIIINKLFAEGLIKIIEGKEFIPACMILTGEDEKDIKNFASIYGADIAKIIIEKHSQAKENYSLLNSFYNISFDDASLFILYNVMMDKWQLGNIVEIFLQSDIPHRGSNRSFVMINQNYNDEGAEKKLWIENKFEDFGGYQFCAFGKLSNNHNFIDIKRLQLIDDFRMNESADETAFKKKIIDDLVKFISGNKSAANRNLVFPLNKYGLLNNNQLILPIISVRDNEILTQTAKLVADNLIQYLDRKRPVLVKKYLSMSYKDEVSFREWSFWLYKFMIEEAAKILMDKGDISRSDKELFYYIINK